jgi:asparagine synthase (glutamine-hydrolysing)
VCGIYGSVGPGRNEIKEGFNLAGSSLDHRGPDESGSYLSEKVSLGIKRLAIVDVQNGHQPYSNEHKNIQVVFNGQIYNYLKLRADLEANGHKLNSKSDGEIISHLFEEHGPDFVRLLEGMFAIALWDEKTESLFLYRDRFGKKPLLYSQDRQGNLYFASEMKALKLLFPRGTKWELSRLSLSDYLTYGYVPNPESIFMGMFRLPPATYLKFNSQQVTLSNYWKLIVEHNENSMEENEKKFDLLFTSAIAKRLTGERTIGAFLSGGIDSSLVVAYLSKMLENPVETFSVSFDETKFDESLYAKSVSSLYKTNHHELVLSNSNVLPYFLEMFDYYDEPFADSSSLATFALCKFASDKIVVSLSGDGGDEAFGGYDRYRIFGRQSNLISLAYHFRAIDRKIPMLSQILPPRYARAIRNLPMDRNDFSLYNSLMQLSDVSTRTKLLGATLPEKQSVTLESQVLNRNLAQYLQANLSDIEHYLPDDLLYKVDIASMASSLEIRSPFLDHELFEFGISLPQSQRIGKTGKVLLHSVAGKILPEEVVFRKKMGFGIPRVQWLNGSLNPLVKESLLSRDSILPSILNQDKLISVYKDFDSGSPNDALVWNLLSLEMWARKWLS